MDEKDRAANLVVKSSASSRGDDENNANNLNQDPQEGVDLMEEEDASFTSNSATSRGGFDNEISNNTNDDDDDDEAEEEDDDDYDEDGGGRKPSAVSVVANNIADETSNAAAAAAAAGVVVVTVPEETNKKERMRTIATTTTATASGTGQDKVSHEQRWSEMFNRLLAFRNKNGHCRVPNRFEQDSQLGFWVSAQRRQYKLSSKTGAAASALTPERVRKLEEIGFQWSSTNPHHTPWETRYEELCAFVRTYGHAEVPIRWKQNPKLSHWVSKQRHDYKLKKAKKSSRLSDDKVMKLNQVGFLWEGSRRSLKDKVSVDPASGQTIDVEGETAFEESTSLTQHSMMQMASVSSDGVESLPLPPLQAPTTSQASLASPQAGLSAPTTTALEPPQSSGNSAPSLQLPTTTTTPVAAAPTLLQAPAQAISSEGLAQLLGSVFSNQQQQQPVVAALLIPLQASVSSSGELALAPLCPTPQAPPPAQAPPPVQAPTPVQAPHPVQAPPPAQAPPQGQAPPGQALPPSVTQPEVPGSNPLVDMVSQFLTPLLQQGQQQQAAFPLQPAAPQQHLPLAPTIQQQQPFALQFQQQQQQQQQRVVQQSTAQAQQQVVQQEQPVASVAAPLYQQQVHQHVAAQQQQQQQLQQQVRQADVQQLSVQPPVATSSNVPSQTHLLQALQVIAAATAGGGVGTTQQQPFLVQPQNMQQLQQLANFGQAVPQPAAMNTSGPGPASSHPEGNHHSETPPN